MMNYQSVLVPLDTSQLAELALAKAVAVAERNNAHLDLLSVIDTHQSNYFGGLMSGDLVNKLVDDATRYLAELNDQVRRTSQLTNVENHIRFGNPKSVIGIDFPHDHQTDLIMMGATGMNAWERALTGSVTDFVTKNSPADVLVVRTDLDNEPTEKALTSPYRTSE
ncbi:universal stress protein [uncultured Secundilactobacillus sp.]|uniref:universal stress protein n=1 Tax=uncultured Secundilactobacillus sp. TaxID=2813935 RepID=UPI00338E1000